MAAIKSKKSSSSLAMNISDMESGKSPDQEPPIDWIKIYHNVKNPMSEHMIIPSAENGGVNGSSQNVSPEDIYYNQDMVYEKPDLPVHMRKVKEITSQEEIGKQDEITGISEPVQMNSFFEQFQIPITEKEVDLIKNLVGEKIQKTLKKTPFSSEEMLPMAYIGKNIVERLSGRKSISGKTVEKLTVKEKRMAIVASSITSGKVPQRRWR